MIVAQIAIVTADSHIEIDFKFGAPAVRKNSLQIDNETPTTMPRITDIEISDGRTS